jgi:glycosyltransferase involved in cell wall biosynthesis
LGRFFSNFSRSNKTKDIFFSYLIPSDNSIAVKINKWISRLLLLLQVGRFPKKQDVIWCYWPKGYTRFKESGWSGRLIFDSDHNIVDDPNISDRKKPERIELLKKIGAEADLVLSSARSMLQWFKENSKAKTVLLFNGVDPNRFEDISPEKKSIAHPVVGYVGSLSKWIQYDWLERLVQDHSDWHFVIIGKPSNDENYKRFENRPNVHLLGPKNYKEVPSYIKSFDVAIGLYQKHSALDVNSMKLYEYLAAGVPVICSNYHPNLNSDFEGFIQTAETYKDFEKLIKDNIKRRVTDQPSKLSSFLQKVSWNNRINEFLKTHVK